MLSSVLVYNLTSNIQEDDLQHLQLFTEYGRLALEDSGETPFQELMFLVRDWSYPYEHEYGIDGGAEILQRRLAVSDKQHPELQALRKHINACFGKIDCYLMPHPGLRVATDPRFDGKLCDIEGGFKDHLKTFVPMILSPAKIEVKKISGNPVKCKELVGFFRAYIEIFKVCKIGSELFVKKIRQIEARSAHLSWNANKLSRFFSPPFSLFKDFMLNSWPKLRYGVDL